MVRDNCCQVVWQTNQIGDEHGIASASFHICLCLWDKEMKVKPTFVVEEMMTLAEMQAVMDEFCECNSFDIPLPDVSETNYLAEETDEPVCTWNKQQSKTKR